MFGMGMTEILVILVVALLFLGPEKLPEAAKQLSKGIRDLRKQTREFQDTIENDTQIGGAIRDIKSALRGDELRRPPVRKPPPAVDAAGVPPGQVAGGLVASALDGPAAGADAGSDAIAAELPVAPAVDPLIAPSGGEAGAAHDDADHDTRLEAAAGAADAAGVAETGAAADTGAATAAVETRAAADTGAAAAAVGTRAAADAGERVATADADEDPDEPPIGAVDDELAKMIRPVSGSVGRGRLH